MTTEIAFNLKQKNNHRNSNKILPLIFKIGNKIKNFY